MSNLCFSLLSAIDFECNVSELNAAKHSFLSDLKKEYETQKK